MELENQISQMAENVKGIKSDITNEIESAKSEFKSEINVVKDEMQKQIDGVLASQKKAESKKESKTIDQMILEKLDGKMGEFEMALKSSSGSYRIELPEVKTMLLSNSLTGDPVATYAPNQAIFPSQKVNFRDLVPTVRSTTGLYVFYAENTGETNNIGFQTEGNDKGENNYALTETKVVTNYIAGFTTFSKQMSKSLPFISQTLPRLLQRDFFKKENALFFGVVSAAATGSTTTAETNDLLQLIDYIGNQKAANYNASYVLVSEQQMGRLLKATVTAGYYAGNGSVVVNPNGGITIWGVPVVSASWVTDNKALVIDNDYIERVETESLAIEFSYENGTNFQKNLITARIECMEEINLMLANSAIYATMS
jgi:HK97 family phage major capsid protein